MGEHDKQINVLQSIFLTLIRALMILHTVGKRASTVGFTKAWAASWNAVYSSLVVQLSSP
jgi:hypothetical protein